MNVQHNSPEGHHVSGLDGAVNVAQPVLFPRDGVPRELYLDAPSDAIPALDSDALSAPCGAELSFDTFFNAFFLAYWSKLTDISSLGVRIKGSGRYSIDVYGCTDSENLLCSLDLIEQAEEQICWLSDLSIFFARQDPGRIFFRIRCHSACSFQQIDYVTQSQPCRDVRLSIGLCTFNREAFLKRTLDELIRLRQELPEHSETIIINQGTAFSNPDLLKVLTEPGIHQVQQANLGGAGGFCRGIVEATRPKQNPTHHLLMDDDILLDARVISKTVAMLKFTTQECAIGGSMFELERPTTLYEAGASILPNWAIWTIGRNADLADRERLDLFSGLNQIDYNAWWFCVIPVAAFDLVGLPAPIFLHGDDIEFGCRMKRAGLETYCVPGIGVWHQSFAAKDRGWIKYYDYRNIFINASLYPEVAPGLGPLETLHDTFRELLCHQYDSAWLLRKCVRDFLRGPDAALGPTSVAVHKALLQSCTGRDKVRRISLAQEAEPTRLVPKPIPTQIWRIVCQFAIRFMQITMPKPSQPLPVYQGIHLDPSSIGPGGYALADPSDPQVAVHYRPNRLALWVGSVATLWLALRLTLFQRAAARRWRKRMPELTTNAAWQRQFSVPYTETSDVPRESR